MTVKREAGMAAEAEAARDELAATRAKAALELSELTAAHVETTSKLTAESAAVLAAERQDHDKTREEALAAKAKAAQDHLGEVTRLKEEMLAQSQATRLSESDAAVNLAATQAAHQEALAKLASENASGLTSQKRSMEEEMEAMRHKAAAADAQHTKDVAQLQAQIIARSTPDPTHRPLLGCFTWKMFNQNRG